MSTDQKQIDRLDAATAAESWFNTLGTLAEKLPLPIDTRLVAGWRVSSRWGNLDVYIDKDFPYSRPTICIAEFDPSNPRPHVEARAKLCLRSAIIPDSPVETLKISISEAIGLLKANHKGELDADFQEDFRAYWNQSVPAQTPIASVLLPEIDASHFGACILTDRGPCIFQSKAGAVKWWEHRTGDYPRRVPRVGIIKLDLLPSPKQFPSSARELRWLIETKSHDGGTVLAELVRQVPKVTLLLMVGKSPAGLQHVAVVKLARPREPTGQMVHWKRMVQGYSRRDVPAPVLWDNYELTRLRTELLDGAKSRLPYPNGLETKRVAIVGCGALGSGVARLLAQAGVGRLLLVDKEIIEWVNIRRHELGAPFVGGSKAEALAYTIKRNLPDIDDVQAIFSSVQDLLRQSPRVFLNYDLVVECTADWPAGLLVEDNQRENAGSPPVVFAWMEAHALAAHAVLLERQGPKLRSGFSASGEFVFPACEGAKESPPECGGTTPFGAIELSRAQSMVAGFVIDALTNKTTGGTWRSWVTTTEAMADAGATLSESWLKKYDKPPAGGGFFESKWDFGGAEPV